MSPIRLEDFGSNAPREKSGVSRDTAPESPVQVSAPPESASLERARLEAYEEGYQAGWDDAIRQETESQGRIGAEFARNLQDLGFTFHEARTHVMQTLEPLLTGMVDKVLPSLVSETIGQTILEELMPLAAEAADQPIEVVVTPASREVLEAMLSDSASVPFRIVEESTLAEGQVYIRTGVYERRIDMSHAVDRIGSAIQSLYQLNEKAFQNG